MRKEETLQIKRNLVNTFTLAAWVNRTGVGLLCLSGKWQCNKCCLLFNIS